MITAACSAPAPGPVVCPPLPDYSADYQKRLAAEVRAMERDDSYPVARHGLREWVSLRDQVRACQAARRAGAAATDSNGALLAGSPHRKPDPLYGQKTGLSGDHSFNERTSR